MSVSNLLLRLDKEKLALPKKSLELPRLSELLGQELVFELQGINQSSLDEITEMVTSVDVKTKDFNIDFQELKLAIICEGVKSPSLRDKELLAHFSCSTPYDLVKTLFTSGERDALYNEIQELSGYSGEVIKEIKKQ